MTGLSLFTCEKTTYFRDGWPGVEESGHSTEMGWQDGGTDCGTVGTGIGLSMTCVKGWRPVLYAGVPNEHGKRAFEGSCMICMSGAYYPHVDCETGPAAHQANGEAVSRRAHHRCEADR